MNLASWNSFNFHRTFTTQFSCMQVPQNSAIQAVYTYICYAVLNIFGWFRDFLRSSGIERRKGAADNNGPVSFFLSTFNNNTQRPL